MIRKGVTIIVVVFLMGCDRGSQPIEFGADQCDFCRMTISDPKFGAELITKKGRVYKFDAAECMINYMEEEGPEYDHLYAVAYDRPESLYKVDSLYFLISVEYRSPMGANLAGFKESKSVSEKHRDQLISWKQVCRQLTSIQ